MIMAVAGCLDWQENTVDTNRKGRQTSKLVNEQTSKRANKQASENRYNTFGYTDNTRNSNIDN